MPSIEEQSEERRADLSAAFDKAAAANEDTTPAVDSPDDAPPAPAETAAPEAESATPESAQSERDAKGRFLPGAKPAAKQKEAKPPDGIAQPAAAIGTLPPEVKPPTPQEPWQKPPQSLKPAIREQWAALPPEVQQEWHRRERETSVAQQRAAEAQRTAEPLLRAVQPFAQALAQRGQSADQVIGNMLRTEQALSHPDERVRAQVIVQALGQYRVGIEALAAAIDGKAAPAGQPNAPPAFDKDALLREAEERIVGKIQQQRMAIATQSAAGEIESFTQEAEFLNDVREGVADRLESAGKRGVALSLQEAYEQECWSNSDVRKILQQRETSKQAATGAQATQRARVASSSVKPSPGGPASSAPPGDSWRDHLSASWDKASGR